ncbi:MAG: Holliday junction resolvase RuvX [Patescibacteria group bacterium]
MTILGIDYGEKRIGLALADPKSGAVWPYEVLGNAGNEAVAKRLREVVALENVAEIVVGIPLTLSGAEGHAARAARAFGTEVGAALALSVTFIDERFTSVEAMRVAEEYGSKELDAVAAALILKTYLGSTQNS